MLACRTEARLGGPICFTKELDFMFEFCLKSFSVAHGCPLRVQFGFARVMLIARGWREQTGEKLLFPLTLSNGGPFSIFQQPRSLGLCMGLISYYPFSCNVHMVDARLAH